MTREITVLIADDHPIFRKGLVQIIQESGHLRIVAEAADGDSALQKIEELKPTVAVLDVDMPRKNGLEVAKSARAKTLTTHLVFLTMYREEDMFNEAMDVGVHGYVLKENAVSDIVAAIDSAARGDHYISPSISNLLINRKDKTKALLRKKPELEHLTPMETKILRLIAQNKTSKEIAEELALSHKTVENHRTNIANKLDIHGSHALLKFAIENKSLL